MKQLSTSIRVSKYTRDLLLDMKLYPRETYDDILQRAILLYDELAQDEDIAWAQENPRKDE